MPTNNDIIEQISSMSVSDLLNLVKELESKWNISASSFSNASSASEVKSDAKVAEEKSSFSVHLVSSGEQKISVIKVIREITGLGLKEAKDLVDSAPKVIKEGVSSSDANDIKKKIEDVGGKVELK